MNAQRRLLTSAAPGVVFGLLLWITVRLIPAAILGGWDLAALIFLVWTWRRVWFLDQKASQQHAEEEDPTTRVTDIILLNAAVVSLAAIVVVLVNGQGAQRELLIESVVLAVASIACSWGVVHTVFALRYARLYYEGVDGGIDFHGDHPPTYVDFAYLAFTIGMTFQVSDTEINARTIRANVLRHALLAYLFGAVILAAAVNILAGLSK
jgi:uncharacterized membrane protein